MGGPWEPKIKEQVANHMNIVRFRLKPELKERVMQAHRDFNIVSWDGAKSPKLVDCGD